MANILDYKNPITGQKGNLLDLKSGAQMVLGVVVLLGVYAGGTAIYSAIKAKLPAKVTTTEQRGGWVVGGDN